MSVRGTASEQELTVRVRHRRNPYAYMLDDKEFTALLYGVGRERAASIRRNHQAAPSAAPRDTYGRTSMGFVVLDPTAGPWVADRDAVLAALTVGEDGDRFLPNAAAKAAGHRRLGRNYGEAVLVDPHLCGNGAFRYGHSCEVRGVVVGASSQSPDQDLYEAGRLARDLVDALAAHHLAWEERVGAGDWFSGTGDPDPVFRDMVSFFEPGASS